MPRKVFLHGNLREKFGGPFEFYCQSTAEAVRLLVANFPDFPAFIAKGSYRVIVGSRRKGRHLEEKELPMIFPEKDSIHIIPTISGAKGGGGKIIIGVAHPGGGGGGNRRLRPGGHWDGPGHGRRRVGFRRHLDGASMALSGIAIATDAHAQVACT